MGGVRKDKVKNLIQLVMEKFINDGSYVFEKTNEFPMAMRFGRLVEEISSTKATYHCARSMRAATSKEIP